MSKFNRVLIVPFTFVLVLLSHTSNAAFNDTERSVNGTGEVLGKGKVEAGFGSLGYGYSDQLMLTIPTVPLILGSFSVNGSYKYKLTEDIRLTPSAGIGYQAWAKSPTANVGATIGTDFGNRKQHSLAFSLTAGRFVNGISFDNVNGKNVEMGNYISGRVEYDYYTEGGNLFYLGMLGAVPYLGYTWAWDNVHFGLISSPVALFIPMPYVYFRF